MKPAISIVMSTYNRGHLLNLSLKAYAHIARVSEFPIELIIIDDGSEDSTYQDIMTFIQFNLKPIVRCIHPGHKPQRWRDCAETLNLGIRAAAAPLIICTHPEVIPGPDTIQCAVDTAQDNVYICARPLYLTPDQQKAFRACCNGSEHNLLSLARQVVDLYPGPFSDYSPAGVASFPTWESWVWGGMTKKTWRDIGGMSEHSTWGTIDVTFLERRRYLKIPNHTMSAENTWVIHQNHDLPHGKFTPTDRNMTTAMSNVPIITQANAKLDNV